VDLGKWLNEEYRVPTDEKPDLEGGATGPAAVVSLPRLDRGVAANPKRSRRHSRKEAKN
jgi:hypothetical protein